MAPIFPPSPVCIPNCGFLVASGWSLIKVVSQQGGLSAEWSLIRVVSYQVVSFQGGFSSGLPLIRVVSRQGGLSVLSHRVVSHQGDLSSGWSFKLKGVALKVSR